MESIFRVLEVTLSPDDAVRKGAEVELEKMSESPTWLSSLLHVISNSQGNEGVASAGALAFKRAVSTEFAIRENSGEKVLYPEAERTVVKNGILEVILTLKNTSAVNALGDAFAIIAKAEFPAKWPDLTQSLLNNLQSNNRPRILATLTLIRLVMKKYELQSTNEGVATPSELFVDAILPTVQGIASSIVDGSLAEESGQALLRVIQIFQSCIKHKFDKTRYTSDDRVLTAWGTICAKVITRPLPGPGETVDGSTCPEDEDERHDWIWWKVKKWAIRSLYYLSSNSDKVIVMEEEEYTNMKKAQKTKKDKKKEQTSPCVTLFRNGIAPAMVGIIVEQLSKYAVYVSQNPTSPAKNPNWISRKYLLYCVRFVMSCAPFSSVWKQLKDHLPQLMDICFLLLRCTPEDYEEFEEDPRAWLDRNNSIMYSFDDPKAAVETLLLDMMSRRTDKLLPAIVAAIKSQVTNILSKPDGQRDYIQVESVIRVFGLLNRFLKSDDDEMEMGGLMKKKGKKSKKINPEELINVEQFLVQVVTPFFSAPMPILTIRAIDTWSSFADYESISTASKEAALKAILSVMKTAGLPVRFAAGRAISSFLNGWEGAVATIQPFFLDLLGVMFGLLGEIAMDDVVSTIHSLIAAFDSRLIEVAEPLTKSLTAAFMSIMAKLDENEEGHESAAAGPGLSDTDFDNLDMTAEALLNVMSAEVEILAEQEHTDALFSISPLLFNVLGLLFDPENMSTEFFSSGCDLCISLFDALGLRLRDSVAARDLVVRMLQCITGDCLDYLPETVPAISTYFAYVPAALDDPRGAPGVPDFLEFLLALQERSNKDSDEQGQLYCGKLFTSCLHFGRGLIDRALKRILAGYISLAGSVKTKDGHAAVAVAVGASLMYSPSGTLASLESLGLTSQDVLTFVSSVVRFKDSVQSPVDMKIITLGSTELLSFLVRAQMQQLAPQEQSVSQGTVVAMLSTIPVLIEHIVGLLAAEQEKIKNISDNQKKAQESAEDDEEEPEEDDEDDDDASADDEIDHHGAFDDIFDDDDPPTSSPLDHVNSILYVNRILQAVVTSPVAVSIIPNLTINVQESIHKISELSNQLLASGVTTGELGPDPNDSF